MQNSVSSKSVNYRPTVAACYIGYITQAAVVSLAPLLFVIYNTRYSLSLDRIGLLISIGFVVQILTDFVSSKLLPKIGYRAGLIAAHVFASVGLLGFGVLPLIMPIFPALLVSYVISAIGGGLTEVIISPVINGIPSKSKSAAMSLLHSFYCWGVLLVVLVTTLLDFLLPDELWYLIPVLWACGPVVGAAMFAFVPLPPSVDETESGGKSIFKSATFWIVGVLMVASGAAEQAISQWASLFAETGLGVDKALGDLLGMGGFAVLMGLARLLYGIFGKRLKLRLTLIACAAVNIGAYLLTVFSPSPVGSLIGCILSGLSIGMAWPGCLSLAAKRINGGTAVFAYMALFGDIGCALGPGLVGWVSGSASLLGSPLKAGILSATVFPVLLFTFLLFLRKKPAPANAIPQDETAQLSDAQLSDAQDGEIN